MVTPLPTDRGVPWPLALKPLGKILDPLLGSQRTAGLRVGLLGAYLGRGLMLAVASLVIQNPWLKLVGAAYLIRLAFDDLGSSGAEDGEDGSSRQLRGKTFLGHRAHGRIDGPGLQHRQRGGGGFPVA